LAAARGPSLTQTTSGEWKVERSQVTALQRALKRVRSAANDDSIEEKMARPERFERPTLRFVV